jgi:uncharacterized protein YjdB
MFKGFMKKILPVILALALIAPSVSAYSTPVLAKGNDEGVVVQTEGDMGDAGEIAEENGNAGNLPQTAEGTETSQNNSNTEGTEEGANTDISEGALEESNKEQETEVQRSAQLQTGAMEDGTYMLPLSAYTINSYNLVQTGSATSPAWNERAMLIVSGGAITLKLQMSSTLKYDAFQIMKTEESEKYTYGSGKPIGDYDDNPGDYTKDLMAAMMGNATVDNLPMGTFNLPEGFNANPNRFKDTSNTLYYQSDIVTKETDASGLTYLSVELESLEQLSKKMLIKTALGANTAKPVLTSYLVFYPGNLIKMPTLEVFQEGGEKALQLSGLLRGAPGKAVGLSSLVLMTEQEYSPNLSELFTSASISVNNGQITVTGTMNGNSFYDPVNNKYGMSRVRVYDTGIVPAEGLSVAEMLKFGTPYYKSTFKTIYDDYTNDGYGFSFSFDYTMENLVFGVPLSIGAVPLLGTNATQESLSSLSEDALGGEYQSLYARLHVLPKNYQVFTTANEDGQVLLTTDTSNVSEEVVLKANLSEKGYLYSTIKSTALQIQDWSYRITTASGAAITANKAVDLAVRVPEGWDNGTNLCVRLHTNNVDKKYTQRDGTLKIENGWILISTVAYNADIYIYIENVPENLNLLPVGKYSVNISALHANKAGEISLSNDALVKEATLVVRKDDQGELVKELYVDFQVMYFGGIPGYLCNVAVADNYEKKNITYGETMDYFTTGDSEELMLEQSYMDSYGMKVYLIKRSKLTLKEYTGNDTAKKNYYPVYFEVPPMDSDPTDGIELQVVRLMVSNVRKLTDETTLPSYKKTILKQALLEGKEITGEVYTGDSFKSLQTALEAAELIYEKNPSEEEIILQTGAVKEAIKMLIVDESKKADKKVLEQLLLQAESYEAVKDNYTATSYEKLKNAVTLARVVFEKVAAGQTEVDEQVSALQSAIKALVLIDIGALAPADLPAGTYTLPVRLWHAVNNSPSMGDAGITSTGTLVITEGEAGKKATLNLQLIPLEVSKVTGYLMDFDILTNFILDGATGYPKTGYSTKPADVLEAYEVEDSYNASDSSDERSRGRKYPKTVKLEVTLPQASGTDYIWVHVYVPLMGSVGAGDHEARLRLDYTGIAIQGEPSLSLDYTSLTMTAGDTKTLTATLSDSEDTVTWSSSKESVAVVDAAGKITALSDGTTTITAAAGSLLASCIVTVTAAGSGGNNGGSGNGGNSGGTLKNGTYVIPISLWHAAKDQVSLGNAALVQSAKLVINNGTGALYITFQPMTYLGLTGYLSELTPSTVISTYDVVDQYNGDSSTDLRVKGTKYPRSLAVAVVPGSEYTTVRVYVPVMGSLGVGEQDARLKLNYTSAVLVSDSTSTDLTAADLEDGAATISLAKTGGKTYVYEKGLLVTNRLVTYLGSAYYAGKDGVVVTSQFFSWEGRNYYAGEDGGIVTNRLLTVEGKIYFAGYGGVIAAETMLTHEGKRYYATKTGEIAVSVMISYENGKYFAGDNGVIKTSAVITNEGKKYYATVTGKLAVAALVTYKGSKYYAKEDSTLAVSSLITHNGEKYYTSKTGKIAVSTLLTYKNIRYYAGKDGILVTSSLITTSQGLKYYATKTGKIAVSVVVTYKGKKYYASKNGKISTLALITYKNAKYYAGKDGVLVTSKWVTVKGKSYYFDRNGKLLKMK